MKPLKATKSVRSIRSSRSLRSTKGFEEPQADVCSLDNILLVACAKFNCPYSVLIRKETKEDEFYKSLKQSESKAKHKRMDVVAPIKSQASNIADTVISDEIPSMASTTCLTLNSVTITMIYDHYNTLTEICICQAKVIPRILLKIIVLLIPHYRNLIKFTITKSRIDLYTIYELSKILKVSTITDLCLDGSPLRGADYSKLLEATNLQNLSLCRCNIHDDICKLIASKLCYSASGQNLMLLNLSSNHATDEGAKDIAFALRTNRHLRYLNLADNHITDDGAGYILDMLIEFSLSYDEILNMRQTRIEYFKCKESLYAKYLAECRNSSFDEISQISRKSSAKRRKTSTTTLRSKSSAKKDKERPSTASGAEDFFKTKAEMMTAEILGPYKHPFHPDSIKIKDNYIYSLGNMTLTYLNLAYNDLSYISIKKLNKVILYQNSISMPYHRGLLKIVIDGNNLPVHCTDMTDIENLMMRNSWRFSSKIADINRRKARK